MHRTTMPSSDRSQVVEEGGDGNRLRDSDDDYEDEDEIITFDSVCSSSLRDFLLGKRKKDSTVQRLSGSIFRV